MSRRANSFNFCGVKVVRWGVRKRKVTHVYRGFNTVALVVYARGPLGDNPTAAVALDNNAIFDRYVSDTYGRGRVYTNGRLAQDLLALGAITKEVYDRHMLIVNARNNARDVIEAADMIEKYLALLKVKLTAAQQRRIVSARKAANDNRP